MLQDSDHEEELVIPPPRPRSPDTDIDRYGVEHRLKSLLDVAEEDFPEEDFVPKGVESLKKLDGIGYVVSCLSPSTTF